MDPVEQQDWLLMQRVGHGDEAAMAELYDRFVGLVYKSSKQVLTSRAEAEDAVQEIFLDRWKSAERFDPSIASETTFVAMIARRRLIDRGRRRMRRPEAAMIEERILGSDA